MREKLSVVPNGKKFLVPTTLESKFSLAATEKFNSGGNGSKNAPLFEINLKFQGWETGLDKQRLQLWSPKYSIANMPHTNTRKHTHTRTRARTRAKTYLS